MSEMSSEDIKKFLTTDPGVQKIVEDRLGITDGQLDCDDDPEWQESIKRLQKDAKNPNKWKRAGKYKVGSKADKESFLDFGSLTVEDTGGVDLTDGIMRLFYLDGESIGVATVEKDGKIIFIEDIGD